MGRQSKKKIDRRNTQQSILHSLRVDFACTEEEVDLVSKALQNLAPRDISNFLQDAIAGKIPAPNRRALMLDMEDGNPPQKITLTNHPINLLYGYLREKYGAGFGQIYWTAFVTPNPADFLERLTWLKEAPFFEEERAVLQQRNVEVQG